MSLDTANLNLIYDRTESDEIASAAIRKSYQTLGNWSGLTDAERAQLERGTLTYNTLNRVESAVKTLASALNAAGYPVSVTPVLKGSSRVPAGYTQVEYLKSTGTQYINVGFKPNQDTRIVLDVNSPLVSGPVWLFGARTAADSKTYNFLCQGSKYRSDYNDNSSTSLTINPSGRFEIDKDKNITKINGSTASTIPYGAFQCEYNLFLFNNNNAGAAGAGASISIYSCKIYDNGTLVRDFVPVRNSSGTLGLYDIVNGAFYTNQGSGTFTAGADIVGFTAGAEVGKAEDREWQEGDVLYRPQWTTYLDNVQRLRDAYYTLAETGELPKPEDKLGYVGANTIEKVLADIDLLIDCMKSSYRRCGTFRAGNNAAHLPLKGSI